MSFVDDDMGAFFSGLDEVTVTFGAQSCLGHFDTPADIFERGPLGGVESTRYCVNIPADAFNPLPMPKQQISTAATQLLPASTFTVVERKFSEDGRVLTLGLAL